MEDHLKPTHIYHADWGTAPKKRWLARAMLRSDGCYLAFSPVLLGNHRDLIPSIQREVGKSGCALVGFDFPIGIPAAYAKRAAVREFKPFLRNLGKGHWQEFYNVADSVSQISVERPFYPLKPGDKKQAHLLRSLGVEHIDELRRKCERKQPGRRAACPLFWTLGANQVGKGAIVGWQEVLAPALREANALNLWPFDGCLNDLLMPGRIVTVETYPTECYGWFFPEPLKPKGEMKARTNAGGHLLKWANSARVVPNPALARTIREGFPDGDDSFDAVVGLFGIIEVVMGRRQPGEPADDKIRTLEGWILGQTNL